MVDVGETDKKRIGFIVVDGKSTLYGTLTGRGNTREVLHEFVPDVPKEQGRGRVGLSAVESGRLRLKALKDYIKKTAEVATQFFINPETGEPNVAWLILSSAPSFGRFIDGPDSLDPRLLAKILNGVEGLPDLSNPLLAKVLNAVGVCGEEMGFDLIVERKWVLTFLHPGAGEPDLFNPLLAKVLNAVCEEEMGFDPRLQAEILNAVAHCGKDLGFDPRLQAKILNLIGVSCGGVKGFDEAIAYISSVYQV